MAHKAQQAIPAYASQLFNSKQSPMVGNQKAKVTLVEFFDYQCVHCRNMTSIVNDLVKQDKNLRVVYKEFPIFGPSSELAAKAALASKIQGKYLAFHNALMQAKPPLDKAKVMKLAKSVDLNTAKLEQDMQSQAVQDEIKQNYHLAQALGSDGYPQHLWLRQHLLRVALNHFLCLAKLAKMCCKT